MTVRLCFGLLQIVQVHCVAERTCLVLQAQLLLESAQAMKSRATRDGAFATLAACALRYGQLEAVAGASVAALTRNEHLASVLAELAEFCEAKYHDERLVCFVVWYCLPMQSDGLSGCQKHSWGVNTSASTAVIAGMTEKSSGSQCQCQHSHLHDASSRGLQGDSWWRTCVGTEGGLPVWCAGCGDASGGCCSQPTRVRASAEG